MLHRQTHLWLCLVAVLLTTIPVRGQDKKDKKDKKPAPKKAIVAVNPKDAGIDFEFQGEYQGDKFAAQVFAAGDGKFDVYFLTGGLPGAGWDGKTRVKLAGVLDAVNTTDTPVAIKGPGYFGGISLGKNPEMVLEGKDGAVFRLKHVVRKSPTLGAKPPEGAVVLFDGTSAAAFKEGKLVGDLLGVPSTTKANYKIAKLHLEFMTPFMPKSRGQGRGNSGVYIFGKEIQVLDSFALEGKNNECGGIYSERAPLVNMCFPPLSWQTYDVEFKMGEDPKTQKPANLMTVLHNGVKIHENLRWNSMGNIHLQNHGNPVRYRNLWLVEAK